MNEFSTIEAAFFEKLERLSPDEREARIVQVCQGSETLRKQIEEQLERRANADPAATTAFQIVGDRIGPYRLLRKLGEGGMGVVFMAEQDEPVKRRVALKVIKPGMDSAQVVARFEAERQALALMDHANIAKVFDGGATTGGLPYFVMELVQGVPITKYCDDHRLTLRERLALFIFVCRAIQHAHLKGVIHRDIKPSNVLVCVQDGQALPKVIDFGVAKAVEQPLTERTVFTHLGQVMGTLEYMSPEQSEMNQRGIDTRTDVYSLGVMLYELLTGSTPLERKRIREAALDEVLRRIRDEEPVKPSTRLGRAGAELSALSQKRQMDPSQLARLIRGELDWIVMKSIEKERSRRYDSPSSLAHDLERYLQDEPVEAGPPSVTYRLRKYARRHRRLLTTGAAFLLILTLGATFGVWQFNRATIAEIDAVAAQKGMIEGINEVKQTSKSLAEARDNLSSSAAKIRRASLGSDLGLVRIAMDEGKPVRAIGLLERHLPKPGEADVRGFEWFYWMRRLRPEDHRVTLEKFDIPTPGKHHDDTRLISADGRRFIHIRRVKKDLLLKVWDIETGRLSVQSSVSFQPGIGTVVRHSSPDGARLLVSASHAPASNKIGSRNRGGFPVRKTYHSMIDLSTGKKLFDIEEGPLLFTPDGKTLVGSHSPNDNQSAEFRMWDAATGAERTHFPQPTVAGDLSPDGRMVVAPLRPSGKGQLVGNVVFLGKKTPPVPLFADGGSPTFFWPSSGKYTASFLDIVNPQNPINTTLHVWDPETGRLVWQRELPVLREGIGPFSAFSPSGDRLILVQNADATLLDGATGDEIDRLPDFARRKGSFGPAVPRFSPDGKLLVLEEDARFKVWSGVTGQLLANITLPTDVIQTLDFVNGGAELVAFGADGVVRRWDTRPWKDRAWIGNPKNIVGADLKYLKARLSPSGRRIAAVKIIDSDDPDYLKFGVDVLDAHTAKLVRSLGVFPGIDWEIVFSPDDEQLAITIGADRPSVELFDLRDGKRRTLWQCAAKPKNNILYGTEFGFSRDGRRGLLMIPSHLEGGPDPPPIPMDASIPIIAPCRPAIFDLGTGAEVTHPLPKGTYASAATLSPDGKRLAVVRCRKLGDNPDPRRLSIIEIEKATSVLEVDHLGMPIHGIEWSSRGRLLLSGRGPEQVDYHIVDAATGKTLFDIKKPGPGRGRFSVDGQRILSWPPPINFDTTSITVRIWDAEYGQEYGEIQTDGTPLYQPVTTPDGRRILCLRENWESRTPGDPYYVIDGSPLAGDAPR